MSQVSQAGRKGQSDLFPQADCLLVDAGTKPTVRSLLSWGRSEVVGGGSLGRGSEEAGTCTAGRRTCIVEEPAGPVGRV